MTNADRQTDRQTPNNETDVDEEAVMQPIPMFLLMPMCQRCIFQGKCEMLKVTRHQYHPGDKRSECLPDGLEWDKCLMFKYAFKIE